jgi:hypothetical protein
LGAATAVDVSVEVSGSSVRCAIAIGSSSSRAGGCVRVIALSAGSAVP